MNTRMAQTTSFLPGSTRALACPDRRLRRSERGDHQFPKVENGGRLLVFRGGAEHSTRGACAPPNKEAAFTMVEIAISIGVIAFALVAIIGILPTGLQTHRDNREDTIVNQDARVLLEAIKSGGRDVTSDLGSFVVMTNAVGSTPVPTPGGIPTTNLVQLLSDTNAHEIVLTSISGAVATRGSELGFQYQIRTFVINTVLGGSAWGDTAYEVRLRFAWPVLPNGNVNSEANTYIVRALVTGYRDPTNGLIYAQEYRR
jgi:type II secretory pathway pseudopilin PulG